MAVTIGLNLQSLRAQRALDRAGSELGRTFQRLSSGQRINSPSDDAAGLAIATQLRSDSRVASVAIRNANDGISFVSIGDTALGAIETVLTRMAELANQSANGVYSTVQRSPLESEFQALASEVERIANTASFNSISLLSSGQNVSIQVGFNSFSTAMIQLQGVQATLQSLSLANTGSSRLIYSISGATVAEGQAAARTALEAVRAALETVDVRRGLLGASETRLSYAVNNLTVARANFEAADSRIRDIDVAEETAKLVSTQILQEAATAVLAQANQQTSIALKLLGEDIPNASKK